MSSIDPTKAAFATISCEVCGVPLLAQLGGHCPRCLLVLAEGPEDPPSAMPEGRSRQFGDYELLEELARGGMGVVYRARQERLRREVALKMILAGELAGEERLRMFRREAKAAANLHHVNIVPVYEIGEHELQHYFTMRLVPGGRTIAQWGHGRAGQWKELAEAVAKTARAVGYAHDHGVLHRDLKPSNILWDETAGPQVTDFGLAKIMDEVDGSLTISARVFGSPNYMAPEQAGGRNGQITTATDVYGLGAVLYELLAGRPPFRGTGPLDTIRRAAEELPEPLDGVPVDLATICLKCLEKDPRRRYGSAVAFAEDLERWLRGEPIEARKAGAGERLVKWVRRRPAKAALAGTVVATLAAAFTGLLWHNHRITVAGRVTEAANLRLAGELRRVQWRQAEEALAAGRTPDAMAGFARFLQETPDDTAVAARLRSLLERRAFPLALSPPMKHGAPVRQVRLDRSGRYLFTVADDGMLRRWDVGTGEKDRQSSLNLDSETCRLVDGGHRLLLHDREGRLLLWDVERWQLERELAQGIPNPNHFGASDSGRWLSLITADGELLQHDQESGAPRARAGIRPQDFHVSPLVGPGGETLVMGKTRGGAWLWLPDRDGLQELVPLGQPVACIGWNWKRRLAYVCLDDETTRGRTVLGFDLESGLERQRFQNVESWHRVHVSPEGDRLLITRWGAGFSVLDTTTFALRYPWQGATPNWGNVVPDLGFAVAFQVANDGSGRLYNLKNGEPLTEPLQHEGQILHHDLTPDGHRLATGSEDGTARLWDLRMRVGDSAFLSDDGPAYSLALSPDGSHLAVGTHRRVLLQDLAAGTPLASPHRAEKPFNHVGLSPDGRWLVASGSDKLLRVLDFRSGAVRWSNPNVAQSVWQSEFSPDGSAVASAGDDGAVRVFEADTGKPRFAPMRHARTVNQVLFSPNGRILASASMDATARLWDVRDGRPLGPPLRHRGSVNDLAFSPDGDRVATASNDRTAQLWDVATGEPAAPPILAGQVLNRVRFSADGRRVLLLGLKGARLYDAVTSQPVTQPMPHGNRTRAGAFSPDGRWVATGSEDGTARVWDVSTGFPVTERLRHPNSVNSLVWLPDSRRFVTASEDGGVRLWTLSDSGRAPGWLPDLAEALAGMRNEAQGGSVAVTTERLDVLRQGATAAVDTPDQRWLRWFLLGRLVGESPQPP